MFLSAWSLSLVFCSIIVLFLGANAVRTGIRVLRFWDPDSDNNLQIRLENETWLASTLVEYAMAVQGLSLLLDHRQQAIPEDLRVNPVQGSRFSHCRFPRGES